MLIYSLMIIPVIAFLVLLILFAKRIVWWEYALIFIVPLITIVITKAISVSTQTKDFEYWNSYLVKAEYTEAWSTWVDKTCSKEVCTGSDSNRVCHTEYYDCSYCDSHSESYRAYDNIGNSYSISRSFYYELTKKWNNDVFVDMHRNINHHFGCGKDGDKYVTTYNNDFNTIIPITNIHGYTNKVQASRSVFNFRKVDSTDVKRYQLYNYRKKFNEFNYNPIYGDDNRLAIDKLNRYNCIYGSNKQVHMNILVFKNQPIDAAEYQKAYWVGGNKNEFILCIGLNNEGIRWTKVISWTEVETLKVDVEKTVLNMKYDLPSIVDTMALKVNKSFKRKTFKDFNYLEIEPTTGTFIIALILVLLFTIGICIFSIVNDQNLEENS